MFFIMFNNLIGVCVLCWIRIFKWENKWLVGLFNSELWRFWIWSVLWCLKVFLLGIKLRMVLRSWFVNNVCWFVKLWVCRVNLVWCL